MSHKETLNEEKEQSEEQILNEKTPVTPTSPPLKSLTHQLSQKNIASTSLTPINKQTGGLHTSSTNSVLSP